MNATTKFFDLLNFTAAKQRAGHLLMCAMLFLAYAQAVRAYDPSSNANLLYDSQTGTIAVFTSPGVGYTPTILPNWKTTWSHIVPGNFGGALLYPNGWYTDFLFYDKNSGIAEFYSCNLNDSYPTFVFTLALFKRGNARDSVESSNSRVTQFTMPFSA